MQEEFSCDGTGTFKEAINKIEDVNYDCIILDINLPDVMSLYNGLNDIEPVTIIGVLLAVIAVTYNLIFKLF